MSVWNAEHTVEVYSIGIVHASVCAPKEMLADEVVRITNETCPTGISSDWQLSENEEFHGGKRHPCACESDAARLHWLMVC